MKLPDSVALLDPKNSQYELSEQTLQIPDTDLFVLNWLKRDREFLLGNIRRGIHQMRLRSILIWRRCNL